jgi:replicative DNA helicase
MYSALDGDIKNFFKSSLSQLVDKIDVDYRELLPKKSEFFTVKVLKDSTGGGVKNEAVHNIMHRFIRKAKENDFNKMLILGAFGHGKSLCAGAQVLTYSGDFKKVEDVRVGDLLMGPDSRPRKVLFLGSGKEIAYRITLSNGDLFECNQSHKLALKVSKGFWGFNKGEILDNVLLTDYLQLPKEIKKRCLKMYKSPLEFEYQKTLEDPYEYGKKIGNFRVKHKDVNTQFYRI